MKLCLIWTRTKEWISIKNPTKRTRRRTRKRGHVASRLRRSSSPKYCSGCGHSCAASGGARRAAASAATPAASSTRTGTSAIAVRTAPLLTHHCCRVTMVHHCTVIIITHHVDFDGCLRVADGPPVCAFFTSAGGCKWGRACRFDHSVVKLIEATGPTLHGPRLREQTRQQRRTIDANLRRLGAGPKPAAASTPKAQAHPQSVLFP